MAVPAEQQTVHNLARLIQITDRYTNWLRSSHVEFMEAIEVGTILKITG
jgi:hypothetical protein